MDTHYPDSVKDIVQVGKKWENVTLPLDVCRKIVSYEKNTLVLKMQFLVLNHIKQRVQMIFFRPYYNSQSHELIKDGLVNICINTLNLGFFPTHWFIPRKFIAYWKHKVVDCLEDSLEMKELSLPAFLDIEGAFYNVKVSSVIQAKKCVNIERAWFWTKENGPETNPSNTERFWSRKVYNKF